MGKLHIVSWNVFCIGIKDLEDFLTDSGKDLDWGVLLLQEFTACSSDWRSSLLPKQLSVPSASTAHVCSLHDTTAA